VATPEGEATGERTACVRMLRSGGPWPSSAAATGGVGGSGGGGAPWPSSAAAAGGVGSGGGRRCRQRWRQAAAAAAVAAGYT
jgi:hypothetical protein